MCHVVCQSIKASIMIKYKLDISLKLRMIYFFNFFKF